MQAPELAAPIGDKLELYCEDAVCGLVEEGGEIFSWTNLVLRFSRRPGVPGSIVRTTTNCVQTTFASQ